MSLKETWRRRPLAAALAIVIVGLPGPGAAETGPAWIPDGEELEAAGATFGEILLVQDNVFDPNEPKENKRVFRAANRLHRVSRPDVIRNQLLFKTGEPYSERLMRESERILRATEYLADAQIRPVRYADNRVDVEVWTRDSWTLQGGVGFGRSGGTNALRFGLQDENFLGFGKDLMVSYTSDADRAGVLYRYRDPQLFGSRLELLTAYEDNDDGYLQEIGLDHRFYSLNSRWAAGGGFSRNRREDRLYSRGSIRDAFVHDATGFRVYAALSRGLRRGQAVRWGAGLAYQDDVFQALPGAAAQLPDDRTLAYPFVRIDWIGDGFREMHNLDHIGTTEDVNFGHEAHIELGWSMPRLGADRSRAVFDTGVDIWRRLGGRALISVSVGASGRWSDRAENVDARSDLRFFLRDVGAGTFLTSLSLALAHNPDRDNQLLLGGDNGLRGYPLRFAEGDLSYLLTLEQRWYTGWHPFHVARIGAAVFADIGEARFSGARSAENLGLLTDVGVGLRIGSSLTSSFSMVHIDIALPLANVDSAHSVQFLVTTQERF